MIYRAHPDVGAILHIHAWMDGIVATDVNYPCGTSSSPLRSPISSRRSRIPRTRSSGSGTTASPAPATASRRSSTASRRRCFARCL